MLGLRLLKLVFEIGRDFSPGTKAGLSTRALEAAEKLHATGFSE